jgi:hypothetical protein
VLVAATLDVGVYQEIHQVSESRQSDIRQSVVVVVVTVATQMMPLVTELLVAQVEEAGLTEQDQAVAVY